MAQGRPLSRHGRYDAFVGMPVTETNNNDFYTNVDYSSPRYSPTKAYSGYRNEISDSSYDQYARVSSPPGKPSPRPMSRRGSDGSGQSSHNHFSRENSDESFPSSPSQPNVSPEQAYCGMEKMRSKQPRPPSSSSRPPTSGRPPSASARVRSARSRQLIEQGMPEIPSEDLPDMSVIRPPSSFSKYRLLPAIGTPVPPEEEDTPPVNHLYNVIRTTSQDCPEQPPQQQQQHSKQNRQINETPTPRHSSRKSGPKARREHARVSSAVSDISAVTDISVISSKASARSQKPFEETPMSEFVEKLDLSLLEKPSEGGRRRKTSHSSPAHNKSKTGIHQKPEVDNSADLYDGDDDDSDSGLSNISKRESAAVTHHPVKSAAKKPVVIPSPDHPAPKEVLLAVKLPTDGTRHQRYFRSDETLQSVVDFAEEVASQDFGGYILVVASAPKNVLVDLTETIENAGLEDKTTLHLEEYD